MPTALNRSDRITTWCALVLAGMFVLSSGAYAQGQAPDLDALQSSGHAIESAPSSLLDAIHASAVVPRARGGAAAGPFTPELLERLYGVKRGDPNAQIDLDLSLDGDLDEALAAELGLVMYAKYGDMILARAPISRIPDLMGHGRVLDAKPVPIAHLPTPPDAPPPARARTLDGPPINPLDFDRQGYTGKGVIVAILDSGIDWRHPDFLKPDGYTRVLRYYDMFDDTFARSGGADGDEPPVVLTSTIDGEDKNTPRGTVYTSEHINRAISQNKPLGLNKTGAPLDPDGHGTAVAGVAAGGGHKHGVVGAAPEADLVVVRVDLRNTTANMIAAEWIADMAKELGRPMVMNMSWGNSMPPRVSTAFASQVLDRICATNKPGLIACVAAGNDGRLNISAKGRFGRKGDINEFSEPIELNVFDGGTQLVASLSAADDWILFIRDEDGSLNSQGGGFAVFAVMVRLEDGSESRRFRSGPLADAVDESDLQAFRQRLSVTSSEHRDDVKIILPHGRYTLRAIGRTTRVASGEFTLSLPAGGTASFGTGAIKERAIGSPGTSRNAITVGSTVGQTVWRDQDGRPRRANLTPGALSDFSSQGFLDGGRPKPDIVAPGEFIISTLATGSKMAERQAFITSTGQHLAWQGASAASPFVAGVIALMLEKNPTLTAAEVREILRKSAIVDEQTGGVPNHRWGWGKINPAAAIAATPTP